MDQSTTAAATASISPPESIVRDVQVMLSAGAVAIAISSLLAIGGIPVKELDKWMFALSVPWFVLLYLVSRKPSFFKQRLIKPIHAIGIAAAAVSAASTAFAHWISEIVRALSSLLH
jgi:hypothetical protein